MTVKPWPTFADPTHRRQFRSRLALALAYAALAVVLAVIGAKVLFALAAVLTAGFAYEVVRFCFAHRQSGA
jgi:hypothetical protein